MIDELPRQLDSLASSIDAPLDLTTLHRRIAQHRRRRSAVTIGVSGVGLAAVVGGLAMVRQNQATASEDSLAAAAEVTAQSALPDCATVVVPSPALEPNKVGGEPQASGANDASTGLPPADFKGLVTILSVDGQQLTFHSEELPGTGTVPTSGTLDDATVWLNADVTTEQEAALQVGDRVGLATAMAADGVEHVVFLETGVADTVVDDTVVDQGAIDAKKAAAADSGVESGTDSVVIRPAPTLAGDAVRKAMATITTVDTSTITMKIDDGLDQGRAANADPANTPFYAGDTQCAPVSATAGEKVAVAYHVDDADNITVDAVITNL